MATIAIWIGTIVISLTVLIVLSALHPNPADYTHAIAVGALFTAVYNSLSKD